jgi:putative NADH-flavin reductase
MGSGLSALGQKRADISLYTRNVRFGPKRDIVLVIRSPRRRASLLRWRDEGFPFFNDIGQKQTFRSAIAMSALSSKSGHQQLSSSAPVSGTSKTHLAVRLPKSHMTMSAAPTRALTRVARLLIIGASRGIGLETVKAALKAGHSVRALARSARRIPVGHPKLEKLAGDALEMATMKRALTGIDAVVQSLGVSAGPEFILKPTRLFSKATQVLVTAMQEVRVKRLICVTGFGAGDSYGSGGFLYNVAFHLLLGRIYDDKDVQERIVRRSKLDWVIVRPVILTSGPKTKAYRALVDPRDWTCGFISRANVADFIVKQIDNDTFLHKTPVLTS